MDQLDKLTDSMNADGYGSEKHQWMIDYLERNLQEEKDASSELSNKLMNLQDRIITRDSSIIMNTTMGQKEIAQTAMQENSRIVEKNIENQFENNRYMLIVLFIFFLCIITVSLSAKINISLGPANISIFIFERACFFASATHLFPGPIIISTLSTDSVPHVSAAIA